MTYTYAILPVSQATFDEIKAKLLGAGYDDQLHEDPDGLILDMHGIALQIEPPGVIGAKPEAPLTMETYEGWKGSDG